ncbi:MAG: rhodanese-like domain-containing protein [Rubrivivax sp.]|nr:rhodanese-like domain-containing protein [Rubrivivax sp.]
MKLRIKGLALAGVLLAAWLPGAQAQPAGGKPNASMPAVCTSCHKPMESAVRGYFEGAAFKSQSIQLELGTSKEIVRFDPKALKVRADRNDTTVDHLKEAKKGHEALIVFTEKDGIKTAKSIEFKPPLKIAQEKLIFYPEIEKLVAQGPERGGYTLIDSRPLLRFQMGTIPTSVNLPFPTFDKFLDRLPKDKNKLLIFYCQGETCMMSPSSLQRAEAMGYTKVRVYREGWPEWTQKKVSELSAQGLKAAWIDKDVPHVLIDARAPLDVARGHIPGAVSMTPDRVKAALKNFPDKSLKAPFMVYDAGDDKAAMAVASQITAAGYPFVSVVPGGLAAWTKAGYAAPGGVPVHAVAYTPKPLPGEIPLAEFKKYAAATPAEVLILDVRSKSEANLGMIPGAMLIPDEELAARLAEVPKGKRIIAHCSTGVRAEMAYHKLKAAGFNAGFVKADIEFDKKGKVTIN